MIDAERFIAAIVREPLIEVRYRLPNGKMAQRFFERAIDAAAFAQDVGGYLDTYVGMAPRVRHRGRSEDVARAWVVSADCDDDASVIALERFTPAPSIVVRSGGVTSGGRAKLHPHWLLREPIDRATLEDGKGRLSDKLGSDRAITDAARIMRAPGTGNFKTSPPRRVEIEFADFDRRFEIEEVLRACVPASVAPPLSPAGGREQARDDFLLEIPASEYVAKLSGRSVERNGFVRCPFHKGGEERTPSLKLYETTWACFGCEASGGRRVGGSIYTFAALLWGFPLPLRGVDFLAVAETLRDFFMRDAEAA